MGEIWQSIITGLAEVIKFLASLAGNNIAIGIIFFTILVRLLILPLTLKAVRSSRAMQQLQPAIKEINEKYKPKKGERLPPEKAQEKQAETLALYKEYNVNPAASCLPILIQLPVFFAVFGAVSSNVLDQGTRIVNGKSEAYINGFLWMDNLKHPDPLYILPVVMVVFQFVTQRMAMPKGGGADEQQRRINSIMQWTPLIFGFTAFNFPAAPVIYWVTTAIFSFVQQYFITGWGSLSDIPGLGFLPVKQLPKVELKKRIDDGKPRKPTLMDRLADQQNRINEQKLADGKKLGSVQAGGIIDGKTGKVIGNTSNPGKIYSQNAKSTDAADSEVSSRPNNFGRRAGAGPLGSKSETAATTTSTNGNGNGTRRTSENNSALQAASKQISRPPKKVSPNGNNNNRRKK